MKANICECILLFFSEIHFKAGYIVMFVITLKLFVLWLVAQIFVLGPYITFGDSSGDNAAYALFYMFSKIVYYVSKQYPHFSNSAAVN